MSALRIGYDATPLGGRHTGVGNYTGAVLQALLAEDVEVCCLSSGRARPDLSNYPVAMHRHLPLPTRAMYLLWQWTGRPRADLLLDDVDVYHATNYFLPPVASARTVLTIYDLAFLKHPEWCSPKIVGPFSRGVVKHAHRADAILTCSEATRMDIVDLLGVSVERVHVAYGAVDPALGAAHHAGSRLIEGPYILFVSTLEPRKNIEGMLRAFALAAKDIPHTLVLAGGVGWGMEGLGALIESLGIAPRVKRMGYVDDADMHGLYAEADVFFFPSHYEGFGLPVLEAMACGCPVITSRTSSLPEVGGEAAHYVDPNDIDAMAEALRQVLGDASLRETMGARGEKQAAKFSWKDAAARTLAVYRSLV
jgi:glycosyltransferase involved in cell wall biosynthesis